MNQTLFFVIAIVALLIGLKIIRNITMFFVKAAVITAIIAVLILVYVFGVQV